VSRHCGSRTTGEISTTDSYPVVWDTRGGALRLMRCRQTTKPC